MSRILVLELGPNSPDASWEASQRGMVNTSSSPHVDSQDGNWTRYVGSGPTDPNRGWPSQESMVDSSDRRQTDCSIGGDDMGRRKRRQAQVQAQVPAPVDEPKKKPKEKPAKK